MSSYRLPSMKSLIYFEAAARLGSFTLASVELNVTQGAVSRQLKVLEDFIGQRLFVRHNRQITLTDDGHHYFVSVAHILRQLVGATDALVNPSWPGQITVATSSALASMYLLPRLPLFRSRFPDIQIRIVARDDADALSRFDYDLGLYYFRQPPKGMQYRQLFEESIFPVCSPQYLASHPDQFAEGRPADEMLSQNLIWLESAEDWINWPEWFDRMSIPAPELQNRLVLNHYQMVVQAAMDGQGVALAWSGLLDRVLAEQTLVRPMELFLTTGSSFYLVLPEGRPIKPETSAFQQWLQEKD